MGVRPPDRTPPPVLRPAALAWVLAGLMLSAAGGLHAEEIWVQRVPLPLGETRSVIAAWLSADGLEVRIRDAPMGACELQAEGARGSWRIEMRPSSALATELKAVYRGAREDERRQLERLSDRLKAQAESSRPPPFFAGADLPEAVARHRPAVVCISAESDGASSQHTGFAVDAAGLIVSTTHGMKGREKLWVELQDGRRLSGSFIRFDPNRDLALIRVAAPLDEAISAASGRRRLEPDERVYSIGCPAGRIGQTSTGSVEASPRRAEHRVYWQVGMDVQPGSSGSPVFDGSGRLAGIVKGRLRGSQTIGFLIPLETLIEFFGMP